ncbi:MAG: tRNA (5-methylaminomethyl-2-thiouridine)(34)-methyltransferase MnmD, partial [Arenibacterium sp.]
KAEIEWRDGLVPVSTQFDDPYFSLENGLAETRHVFLAGNDLPERFRDGFCIGELGFGTGLNFLATLTAWRDSGARGAFQFVSFESFPLPKEAAARALRAFPAVAEYCDALLEHWDAVRVGNPITIGPAQLHLIVGDARDTLPCWPGQADAWFLDGFSPAKNPELWEAPLLVEVARHTREGGTAATYTAAGFVRRALNDAGFDVTRSPGFGRKRHMTRARMPA